MAESRGSTSETLVDAHLTGKDDGLNLPSSPHGRLRDLRTVAAVVQRPAQQSKLGAPTALGFLSFAVCLSIMSFGLVGLGVSSLTTLWGDLGVFLFGGGGMMALTAVLEILRGDSIAFAFFGAFATYWFGLSAIYRADFGVIMTASRQTLAGQPGAVQLNQALGLWQMTYTLLCVIFAVATLRTNIVFCSICTFLVPFFLCLSILFLSSLSQATTENMATAAGCFGFIICMLSWYMVAALLLSHGGAPLRLPLGNLKNFWTKDQGRKRACV
ncbi:hypothetical protein CBOM_02818 [Ceraceosorus bombacis]|uniref:GPR1/FUN34/yaaH n=1 Tax=Ceraceosorus bombacis TaxID=401625 RepID=A0A0P1BG20_9BASI|nr:hypothetical protein CBOM_02818 [Ceraceosorus bombacis]